MTAMKLTVISEIQETSVSKTIIFGSPADKPLSFVAGQFIVMDIDVAGSSLRRCYSISSSEQEVKDGRIAITVKKVSSGAASAHLVETSQTGRSFSVLGPFGDFTRAKFCTDLPVVMLAAGSGITPIFSMLKSWAELPDEERPEVTLLYFSKDTQNVIFLEDLNKLASVYSKLSVHIILTRENSSKFTSSKINLRLLHRLCPDIAVSRVALCGPDAFMQVASELCYSLGADTTRMYSEAFSQSSIEPKAKVDAAQPGYANGRPDAQEIRITFDCLDKTITTPPGDSLLNIATRAGIEIRSACEVGSCGECRIKLTDGEVDMSHQNGITQQEEASGYILACCSKVSQDIRVNTKINRV